MSKDDGRSNGLESRKEKRARQKAQEKPTKRASLKAETGVSGAAKKLGKTLHTGGAFVANTSKSAYRGFNAFTQGDPAKKRQPARRGAGKKAAPPIPTRLVYVIFWLGLLLVLSVMGMVMNNASVTVERQTISVAGLPKDLEGYTILHISDLHGRSFGTKQASLLRSINELSYNMIAFTGDMIGRSGNAQPFYDLLEGIAANRPMFFISGDSDPAPLLYEPRSITGTLRQLVLGDWVIGAEERGATYLDATTGIKVGQTTLWLSPADDLNINIQDTLNTLEEQAAQEREGAVAAFEDDLRALPLTDYRRRRIERVSEAVHEMQPEDLHIALSHYPPSKDFIDTMQALDETAEMQYQYLPSIDLVLAGHYCGGGWKVPGYGALYVPNTMLDRHGWFPSQEDVQGFKRLGVTQLYTSPGLSVTDKIVLPNFRLFNAPTITLITLTAAVTDDLLGG